MTLPNDYTGGPREAPQRTDGDIVGPAGQAHRSAAKPGSEQIAAWGGIAQAETEVNETAERPIKTDFLAGQPTGLEEP